MIEYNSSEELQRHRADVFAQEKAREQTAPSTEKEKVATLIDRYISQHSTTRKVRELAQENKRTADYQLDLSADIVGILEKIKSELR